MCSASEESGLWPSQDQAATYRAPAFGGTDSPRGATGRDFDGRSETQAVKCVCGQNGSGLLQDMFIDDVYWHWKSLGDKYVVAFPSARPSALC